MLRLTKVACEYIIGRSLGGVLIISLKSITRSQLAQLSLDRVPIKDPIIICSHLRDSRDDCNEGELRYRDERTRAGKWANVLMTGEKRKNSSEVCESSKFEGFTNAFYKWTHLDRMSRVTGCNFIFLFTTP